MGYGSQAQVLDLNNVAGGVFPNGALFWAGSASNFEVPRGSGLTTIFAANLWIGAIDDQGMLYVNAQTYAQGNEGGPAFNFGPVADSGSYTPGQMSQAFNRVIKLNASDIASHRLSYADSGYTPSLDLQRWPGSGDTSRGVSPVLAPFHDTNGDGLYDPADGDFPVILGDQSVHALASDSRAAKQAGNPRMNVNVSIQTWAVNIPGNEALNNTIFVRARLHNVSGRNYDTLYIGNWTDLDIGAYTDDFVGSDPARDMYYGYNATNNDDSTQGGYGTNPPAQAVLFLSHPMNRFIYYNNDTSALGNPSSFVQKYAYMQGLNLAGQPLPEQFMFSGDPVAGTGSNELSLGNLPGDRRGLGVMPALSLPAGASLCVDFAYVYGRGNSYLNSITVMREHADAVRTWYNAQSFSCEGLYASAKTLPSKLQAKVYPNPFHDELRIVLEESLSQNGKLRLYDLTGRMIYQSQLSAGEREWQIAPAMAPGIYLLQLQSGDRQFSSRVIKH